MRFRNQRRTPQRPARFRGPWPVWFLGDSITLGLTTTSLRGFRKAVYDHIQAQGYSIDFLGTASHGDWVDNQHDGLAGALLQGTLDRVTTLFGPGNAVPMALVVYLLIGTNDVRNSSVYDVSGSPALYAQILNAIHDRCPGAHICVSSIPAYDPALFAFGDAHQAEFNTNLVTVWNAHDAAYPNSPDLIRWDCATLLGANPGASGYYSDGQHISDAGDVLVGAELVSKTDSVLQLAVAA